MIRRSAIGDPLLLGALFVDLRELFGGAGVLFQATPGEGSTPRRVPPRSSKARCKSELENREGLLVELEGRSDERPHRDSHRFALDMGVQNFYSHPH